MKTTEQRIVCRRMMIMTATSAVPLILAVFIDLTDSSGYHASALSRHLMKRYCVLQEVIRDSIGFTIPKMAQTSNTQGIYELGSEPF